MTKRASQKNEAVKDESLTELTRRERMVFCPVYVLILDVDCLLIDMNNNKILLGLSINSMQTLM